MRTYPLGGHRCGHVRRYNRIGFEAAGLLLAHDTVAWAADRMRAAARTADRSHGRLSIGLHMPPYPRPEGFPKPPDAPESYRTRTGGQGGRLRVLVAASDQGSLAYALTELAERIAAGRTIEAVSGKAEEEHRPAVPVRGIRRAFSSVHEGSPWFRDRRF